MIFIYALKDKYENQIVLLTKLFISFYAIWFVLQKDFDLIIPKKDFFLLFLILSIFSLVNWWLEIKKWQFLSRQVQDTDFKTAFKQSLVSFSLALLTPNRMGEYGAKAMFYPKSERKKILGLNFLGNTTQLLTTVFFGIVSLIFLLSLNKNDFLSIKYLSNKNLFYLLIILLFSLGLYFFIYKKFNFSEIFAQNVFLKSFGFSILRYLTFSTQFFLLYFILHPASDFLMVFMAIYLSYFLSALIPVLIFTDWAVKGSVSLWVFTKLGLISFNLLKIVGFMWIFNFLIPFFLGVILLWFPKIFSK